MARYRYVGRSAAGASGRDDVDSAFVDRDVRHLIRLAVDDGEDQFARSMALASLGTLRASDVVPEIGSLIGHPNRVVSMNAAESLGDIDSPEARKLLAHALEHSSDDVRRSAARAASGTMDAQLLAALEKVALGDPTVWVRHEAMRSLADSASPQALAALEAARRDGASWFSRRFAGGMLGNRRVPSS